MVAGSSSNKRKKNKPNSSDYGIYDENDRLVRAALWGPAGAETLLASLYPPEISLFYDDMNVISARQEILGFADLLKHHNVEITMIRDELAKSLPSFKMSRKKLVNEIVKKSREICKNYKTTWMENSEGALEFLIDDDIRRYGEESAIALNISLSLLPQLPLGNSLYARDQMMVFLNKRVQSNMSQQIRRGEVALYEKIYSEMDLAPNITLPPGETFEGGDAYIHDGVVFVGVGPRTTKGGAVCIYEGLKNELKSKGMEFVIVEDRSPNRPRKEKMNFMHIDTFSGPAGQGVVAICEEEGEHRRISKIKSDENGNTIIEDTGYNFMEYLDKKGNDLIIIPLSEQQEFGANFLALDDRQIIVPLETNSTVLAGLRKAGKEIIHAPLFEVTRGFGAAHCITGQLKRE